MLLTLKCNLWIDVMSSKPTSRVQPEWSPCVYAAYTKTQLLIWCQQHLGNNLMGHPVNSELDGLTDKRFEKRGVGTRKKSELACRDAGQVHHWKSSPLAHRANTATGIHLGIFVARRERTQSWGLPKFLWNIWPPATYDFLAFRDT